MWPRQWVGPLPPQLKEIRPMAATIKPKDVKPVLVCLYTRPDVNQATPAVMAFAVTKIWCTGVVPDRRKHGIDTN